MPAENADEVRPIVILGTGRCGSTFLQTALCGVSDIWIWGEHDGILRGIFHAFNMARNSSAMKQFSFPYVGEDPHVTLKRDGTRAAWLCPFSSDDLAEAERNLVVSLFNRRLPPGKTRWGFKEIRYGPNSGVPERMLSLFPKTKVIHAVRHPLDTVSSSVRAWHPEVFDESLEHADRLALVTKHVRTEMARWRDTTAFLAAFCASNPDSTITVQMEQADASLPKIIAFLDSRLEPGPIEVLRQRNAARAQDEISSMIVTVFESELKRDTTFKATAASVNYSV
jgi:hypothetical protein